MKNIDGVCALSVRFDNPWLLLLIIPAIALTFLPYLRIKKHRRRTFSRVASLVLHCIIIALCTAMLSGMKFHSERASVKSEVIILADVSDSNSVNFNEMNGFINRMVSGSDVEHGIEVMLFANGCVHSGVTVNPSDTGVGYITGSDLPETDATDIAGALHVAANAISSPKDGRIILLTDGEETDGNALAAVKEISDSGIKVDAVYFSKNLKSGEVQINSVTVPKNVLLGETVPITVTMQSSAACTAALKIFDNGSLSAERQVSLSGGTDIYTVDYLLRGEKFHEIAVEISSANDEFQVNNKYYTYINISSYTRVLLVSGAEGEGEKLNGVIRENHEVTAVNIADVPLTAEELGGYDEVILMNVANADLPDGFASALTEYVNAGGGLLTAGGDKAYRKDDMNGTEFEELLPVISDTAAKTLGLMLVIDCSGSMNDKATGTNKTRIELAKEAAKSSVNALAPDDYVGIVTFNSEASTLVEMTPVTRKSTILRKIDTIETSIGTYYEKALTVARNEMISFKETELKHIIFITDGEPVDPDKAGFMGLIDRLGDITLSTVALGPSVPTETVKEMATRGGGRFYNVKNENDLVSVIVEETTTAAGKYYNDAAFSPVISSHTAAVAGISKLPELGGYYGTRLKDGATQVLSTDGAPVYAEWSRGEGKVGSFTSDLSGKWSAKYFAEAEGLQFINNAVNSLLPKEQMSTADVNAAFIKDNFTQEVRVTVNDGKSGGLSGEIIAPDGKAEKIQFSVAAENIFAARFKTEQPGVYTVNVICGGETFVFYTAFSFSEEYLFFKPETDRFTFTENLSKNGGGKILMDPENIFGGANEIIESDFDPRLTFLIISLVLFLADIVVRKFKFTWLTEFFSRKSGMEKRPQQ